MDFSESTSHLFLHWDLARNVWLSLMSWLDLNFIMPPNLFIHWECWSGGPFNNKKVRNGLRMIWVIWKVRNDCIFNNVIARWDVLVEEVKVLSWRLLLGRSNSTVCLFYKWSWGPRECLLR